MVEVTWQTSVKTMRTFSVGRHITLIALCKSCNEVTLREAIKHVMHQVSTDE